MIKAPCSREENHIRIDCERRCVGCRATCEAWAEYQKKVDAANEKKKVERILNDISRERSFAIKHGCNSMKRMLKRMKQESNDHGICTDNDPR